MISAPSLTKAERLAIGGAVAPVVRRQMDAQREVTLLNKDGASVGKVTTTDVAKGMLARADIEFSVQPSAAARLRRCVECAAPFAATKGRPEKRCVKCRGSARWIRVRMTAEEVVALDALVDELSDQLSAYYGCRVRVSRSYALSRLVHAAANGHILQLSAADRLKLEQIAATDRITLSEAMIRLLRAEGRK